MPAGPATPNLDNIKGLSGTTGNMMVMVGSLKVDEKKQAMDKEDEATATDNGTAIPKKTPQEKEKPAQIGLKLTCAPFFLSLHSSHSLFEVVV